MGVQSKLVWRADFQEKMKGALACVDVEGEGKEMKVEKWREKWREKWPGNSREKCQGIWEGRAQSR